MRTLLIGQSGGPTAVINATVYGAVREARQRGMRVLGMYHGSEGFLNGRYIDFADVSDVDLERMRRQPGAYLGSCRQKLQERDIQRLLDMALGDPVRADALFYIGGNDSADTSNRLAHAANGTLQVIGGNKTMDNDLVGTHFCNGYPSTARYVIELVRALAQDASSMPPRREVVLVEVLGRDAGWVAGAAALAQEPYGSRILTYLPERLVSESHVLYDVEQSIRNDGLGIVVMSEGLRNMSNELYAGSGRTDAFGHVQHGAMTVSDRFTQLLESNGYKVRKVQPGTYMRGAMQHVSDIDRASAEAAGRYAAEALSEGKTGSMVTNRAPVHEKPDGPHAAVDGYQMTYIPLDLTPLEDIANSVRPVPDGWINRDSNGVTPDFDRYVRQLVGPLPNFAASVQPRTIGASSYDLAAAGG